MVIGRNRRKERERGEDRQKLLVYVSVSECSVRNDVRMRIEVWEGKICTNNEDISSCDVAVTKLVRS